MVTLAAIAFGMSSPSVARARQQRTTVVTCRPTALRLWVGRTGVGMGTMTEDLGFTNIGAKSCSLRGYPRIQMLTASGVALRTLDQEAPGAFGITVKTLVLGRRATAYFALAYPDGTGYANLTCPASEALEFTPPQTSATVTLRGPNARIQPYGGTIQHLECGIVRVSALSINKIIS